MFDILTRAGSFVAIIILGFVLRKVGYFKQEDFLVLSKITIRITLPASIISGFAGKEMDSSMLVFVAMGLGFGILHILVGYLLNLRKSPEQKAFFVLNTPGYNIGNFTMPFVQSFLGAGGIVAASLFDTGNAFICLGGALGVASMVKSGHFSAKRLLKTMLTSIPFLCYVTMTVLNLLKVTLPAPILTFAGIVGSANPFIAMLMVGVGFRLGSDPGQIGRILKVILPRFLIAAALACVCYFLLPFSLEARKALVIVLFSPIASAAPAFTGEIGGDTGLASAINSISIVISIVTIVTLLSIMA